MDQFDIANLELSNGNDALKYKLDLFLIKQIKLTKETPANIKNLIEIIKYLTICDGNSNVPIELQKTFEEKYLNQAKIEFKNSFFHLL